MSGENKRLIVTYSGWMECDPEKTHFIYIGDNPVVRMMGGEITGKEYLTLPPEEQANFILPMHHFGEAYTDSVDGELVECDIEVDK